MEADKKKLLDAQAAKKEKDTKTRAKPDTSTSRTGKKRGRGAQQTVDQYFQPKRLKSETGQPIPVDADTEEHPVFEQPKLVTGAKLKQYQLEGLQWMVSLDQNGISGILGRSTSLSRFTPPHVTI
jgi:ATP-dependent DNA helicase